MTAGARLAAALREALVLNPRLWVPAFLLFHAAVGLADRLADDAHGQIVFVTASR